MDRTTQQQWNAWARDIARGQVEIALRAAAKVNGEELSKLHKHIVALEARLAQIERGADASIVEWPIAPGSAA